MESNKQLISQPVAESEQDNLVTGFFAIGMIINIALVVAYIIWAFRQWGKKNTSNK
ncbi:MAG: hypothetical protein GY806_09425 [Gammaproteobacteria bacterium]|nr:hypothetical protein [Gammaproteobacteria bacterium]